MDECNIIGLVKRTLHACVWLLFVSLWMAPSSLQASAAHTFGPQTEVNFALGADTKQQTISVVEFEARTAKSSPCRSKKPPIKIPPQCKRATLSGSHFVMVDREPVRNRTIETFASQEPQLVLEVSNVDPPPFERGNAPFWHTFTSTMSMLN